MPPVETKAEHDADFHSMACLAAALAIALATLGGAALAFATLF